MAFTISPVVIPPWLGWAAASDFIAAIGVRNAVEADSYGTDELTYSPAEMLPRWLDGHKKHWMFAAKLDGRIVGRGAIDALLEEPETCWLSVQVLPECRRLGIGTALAETVENIAR